MKKYTHAWLALMALKRLEDARKSLVQTKKEQVEEMLEFFKEHRDGVVQGAWFPDSVIKDNSTGHISYLRSLRPGETDPRKHSLPSGSSISAYVGYTGAPEEGAVWVKGSLPDRCQAISYTIRDQLQITYEVGSRRKEVGSPIIPASNEVALQFFMLSHYISDAHMPLHCDARPFSDEVHGEMEELWEKQVKEHCKFEPGLGGDMRFILDEEGNPATKSGFQESVLDKTLKELEKRKFSLSFGSENQNVWDYVTDICFFSFLASKKLIPLTENIGQLSAKKFRENYLEEFKKLSIRILSDCIDSIARVWLHVWSEYWKLE